MLRPGPFKKPRVAKVLLSIFKHQNHGRGIQTQSEHIEAQSD